jgi:hypothetical protein
MLLPKWEAVWWFLELGTTTWCNYTLMQIRHSIQNKQWTNYTSVSGPYSAPHVRATSSFLGYGTYLCTSRNRMWDTHRNWTPTEDYHTDCAHPYTRSQDPQRRQHPATLSTTIYYTTLEYKPHRHWSHYTFPSLSHRYCSDTSDPLTRTTPLMPSTARHQNLRRWPLEHFGPPAYMPQPLAPPDTRHYKPCAFYILSMYFYVFYVFSIHTAYIFHV